MKVADHPDRQFCQKSLRLEGEDWEGERGRKTQPQKLAWVEGGKGEDWEGEGGRKTSPQKLAGVETGEGGGQGLGGGRRKKDPTPEACRRGDWRGGRGRTGDGGRGGRKTWSQRLAGRPLSAGEDQAEVADINGEYHLKKTLHAKNAWLWIPN